MPYVYGMRDCQTDTALEGARHTSPRRVLIVGAGAFGCYLARELGRSGADVTVIEREPEPLSRASIFNQARVHTGYHYPRSLLTARRSCVNAPRFIAEYRDCIFDEFGQYYAIARDFSRVTAGQFEGFCRRIGAPCAPAPRAARELFDTRFVEGVFEVSEVVFDAERLRSRLLSDLDGAGVSLLTSAEALRIEDGPDGGARLWYEDRTTGEHASLSCEHVFNCTYASMNRLLDASQLPRIPLRYELAEMPLVELPEPLERIGVTVMDGPFFSLMPFPSRAAHTLSHVRYTPHYSWTSDQQGPEFASPADAPLPPSNVAHMLRDAARFIPSIREARVIDSLWEVKAILPANELDDGRPILLRRGHGHPALTCVLGGKIDQIYDLGDVIAEHAAAGTHRQRPLAPQGEVLV